MQQEYKKEIGQAQAMPNELTETLKLGPALLRTTSSGPGALK